MIIYVLLGLKRQKMVHMLLRVLLHSLFIDQQSTRPNKQQIYMKNMESLTKFFEAESLISTYGIGQVLVSPRKIEIQERILIFHKSIFITLFQQIAIYSTGTNKVSGTSEFLPLEPPVHETGAGKSSLRRNWKKLHRLHFF